MKNKHCSFYMHCNLELTKKHKGIPVKLVVTNRMIIRHYFRNNLQDLEHSSGRKKNERQPDIYRLFSNVSNRQEKKAGYKSRNKLHFWRKSFCRYIFIGVKKINEKERVYVLSRQLTLAPVKHSTVRRVFSLAHLIFIEPFESVSTARLQSFLRSRILFLASFRSECFTLTSCSITLFPRLFSHVWASCNHHLLQKQTEALSYKNLTSQKDVCPEIMRQPITQ